MIQHSFTSGGFPLTVEHLQSIEQQVEHLAAFAKLFFNATGDTKVYVPSDFFTISDGQFAANTAGYVMWKGEMLFVEAATYSQAAQTIYFAIDTASENKVYADNATNPYRTMRTGRFTVAQPASPTDIADSFSTADINSHLVTAIASLARNTVGSSTKPVYINNGVPTAGTYELKKTVDTNAELTDTKVTAVGNHYAPAEDSSAQLSASASGATAAWSIDVVKGVTLKRDAKGHVTGVAVTSGKIPANPDTGATSVEVTGSGNAVTGASYSASTRKLSLTKGTTFLTSHQSLTAYTPTASLPAIGILHVTNYQTVSVSYVHLMGPSNSILSATYSSNQVKVRFNLSKRYMLIPMSHGHAQGGSASMENGIAAGYSGNTNSSYNATQDGSWTAGQYATLRLTGAEWYTILVIGY